MVNQTLGGLPILPGMYQNPPTHIPDGNGSSYKTEFALLRSPERTEKILWWHADDPRSEDPVRQYHNHPWPFQSTILSGGYSEHRYWIKEDGTLGYELATYRQGDINVVPANVFHAVFDVQPGTVTHLECGAASEGNVWGYLNIETLEYSEAKKDPGFWDEMVAINPHLKK